MDRYDPATGQVYREKIVPQQSAKRFKPWEHWTRTSRRHRYFRPAGADTMQAMLLRKIAHQARDLEPEMLQPMPAVVVENIWKAIKREGKESLHIWKLFASGGYGDGDSSYSVRSPKIYKPWVEYFLDMNSPSLAWLVDLRLTNPHSTSADLKSLAALSNLKSLLVSYEPNFDGAHKFDDSVVSKLASCASNDGAFGHLETMFIEGTRDLTIDAFASLRSFPALDTFCVHRTGIKWDHDGVARAYGWDKTPDSGFVVHAQAELMSKQYRPAAAGLKPHDHYRAPSWGTALNFYHVAIGYIQKRHSQDARDLPLLSCQLGRSFQERGAARKIGNLQHMYCFERKSTALPHASTKHAAEKLEEPPKKKRRFNEKRIVGVHTMLDDL